MNIQTAVEMRGRRVDNLQSYAKDPNSYFVHPLALVDDATIGKRSRIWQFASVIRGTVLGEGCNVAHGACLDGPSFGDRCIICHNVAMGPGFVVGDDCFLGPGVVFCNDVWPTVKKEGWSIEQFWNGAVTIRVGNRVSIGANATILPGVEIEDDAVVAAGAVVSRKVPAGMLWMRSGELRWLPSRRIRMRLLDDHHRHPAMESK